MTFWELVEGKTFYWQMFTLSKGRQILVDGTTKRRPMLMPSGQVYARPLSVPADLPFYKVGASGIGLPEDWAATIQPTWVAHFASVTLTISMLEEIEGEPPLVKFFCTRCGKEIWSLIDCWDKARQYTLEALRIRLICSDCILEEVRADRKGEQDEV